MRTKTIILLLSISVAFCLAFTAGGTFGVGTGAGGGATFCTGSELFCDDFEGSDTTWTEVSTTADCDGYDADGDYCDDETTLPKVGSECLGVMGIGTTYAVQATLSSPSSELYFDGYVKMTDVTTAEIFTLRSADALVVRILLSSGSLLRLADVGGTLATASTDAVSADTWFRLRVYYKEETGSDDGIVTVWVGDGLTQVINYTTMNTGSADIAHIRFGGPSAGQINYFDNCAVYQGAP